MFACNGRSQLISLFCYHGNIVVDESEKEWQIACDKNHTQCNGLLLVLHLPHKYITALPALSSDEIVILIMIASDNINVHHHQAIAFIGARIQCNCRQQQNDAAGRVAGCRTEKTAKEKKLMKWKVKWVRSKLPKIKTLIIFLITSILYQGTEERYKLRWCW